MSKSMRSVSLLLALASVTAAGNAASAEDFTQAVARVDQEFTDFLANRCTVPRKQLCLAIAGFRSGTLPSAGMFGRSFYLGRMHSLSMDFRQSLDYPHMTALLMFKSVGPAHLARFEQLRADEPDEQPQIDGARQRIALGKEPLESPLTKFIASLSSQDQYAECEVTGTVYLCRNESLATPIILLRQYRGNPYTVAFGKVPFRPGSFDEVPGRYIAEYERNHR